MDYKKMYIYLISLISGIFSHQFSSSFIVPTFLFLFFLSTNFALLCLCFGAGYMLYQFFVPLSICFATATGTIEYKTKEHLYIYQVQSAYGPRIPDKLKLKYAETESVSIGDKIKFKCCYFPNRNGKISKIVSYKPQEQTWMQKKRIEIKSFLSKSLFAYFLQAITIGDRSGFSSEDVDKLKAGNFWHLVAISGLHMSVLVLSVFTLFNKLFTLSFFINYRLNPRFLAALLATIIGVIYVQISLLSIPAIRALIMTASLMFFGGSLNNKKVLILIAIGMILLDPVVVFNMGFQLSFLCTWILINRQRSFILNLSILPIIQQINLVCLLTNLVVFPLFSIILVCTVFSLLFKWVFLLKITDCLCWWLFKIMFLPVVSIKCVFNPVSILFYIIAFNLAILTEKSLYIFVGFFIIWVFNLCM